MWETHHIDIHCSPVLRRLRQKKNEFDASLDYIKTKQNTYAGPFSFGFMTKYWSSLVWLGTLRWLPL